MSIYIYAQPNVDSLKLLLDKTTTNSMRAIIMFEMGEALASSDPDSSAILFNKGWKLALSSELDTVIFYQRRADGLHRIAQSYRFLGRFEESLVTQQEVCTMYNSLRDSVKIAQCYMNIGNIFFRMGNLDSSLEFYYKSLSLYEKITNPMGVAECFNNIGSVYKELEDFDQALNFHLESVERLKVILNETTDSIDLHNIKRAISYAYNNIGIVYWHKEDNEKSIGYYKNSLDIKLDLNDPNGVAQAYNNIAIVYATNEEFEEAIAYFQKSFEVYTSTKDQNGLAMVNGNIAYLNILLAEKPENKANARMYLNRAVDYAKESNSIAKSIGALPYQLESLGYLNIAYSKLGNYKQALDYANSYSEVQKEIFSKDKADAIAETVAKYEAEKKQLQIDNMEKENPLFQRRIENQRIAIISSTALIALLLGYGTLLFLYLRRKKRDNQRLTIQNEEILQQKEEIQAQLDEIDAQRKEIEQLYLIAIERRNILEKQRDNINDSIRYAQFIQNAVLPDLNAIFKKAGLGETSYFIMYRAKDVVSGDFYWATLKDNWLIATVADCTGHGVPGALMSMLGVSFLNEIVVKNNVIDPASILNELRTHVISSLKQTNHSGTHRDGMEMSIIAINTQTKECKWAGANNPLWVARNNTPHIPMDREYPNIQEFKPDFMPVAAHIKMAPFTNHTITLEPGDRVFLFSDGYADQFGGPEGKKFNMYSAFKRLMSQTSDYPMPKQGEELEANFDTWIGFGGSRFEQTDDVTILGIMV